MDARPSRYEVSRSEAAVWYVLTILFPIIGIVVGIVWATKGRIGPALSIWATALVVIATILIVSA